MATLTAAAASGDLIDELRRLVDAHDGADSVDELRALTDELTSVLRRTRGRLARLTRQTEPATRNPADSPSGELPGPLPPARADDRSKPTAEPDVAREKKAADTPRSASAGGASAPAESTSTTSTPHMPTTSSTSPTTATTGGTDGADSPRRWAATPSIDGADARAPATRGGHSISAKPRSRPVAHVIALLAAVAVLVSGCVDAALTWEWHARGRVMRWGRRAGGAVRAGWRATRRRMRT